MIFSPNIFSLAVDATAIAQIVRCRGNKIIGYATHEEVRVNCAQDIIDCVKQQNYEKACQAFAFLLVPLQPSIPSFTLAIQPVVKGEIADAIDKWIRNSRTWVRECKMNILGLGADGDSKIRKYFHMRCHGTQRHGLSINAPDFTFFAPLEKLDDGNDFNLPELLFPDQLHMIKKWRNQLLNTRRLLVMGGKCAMLKHLMQVFNDYRLVTGLWQTDIWVKDRQNVGAALRLLLPRVRSCLSNYNEHETVATRVYLKIGQKMRDAYACNNLTVAERVEAASMPVVFLRLWRKWLITENYDVNINFIGDQTYRDTIISGHALILVVKVFAMYYPGEPFAPWLFGSDQCEKLFAKIRCFQKTKTNVALIEMIDICARLRKLSENQFLCEQNNSAITVPNRSSTRDEKNLECYIFPDWPDDVDGTVTRAMKLAEAKVLETIKMLGMDHSLRQEGILEESSAGLQFKETQGMVN